jgi:hypothetical protein
MPDADRSGHCPRFSILAHRLPELTYGETCLPGYSCRLGAQFAPDAQENAPPLAFGPDEQIVAPQTCTTARYARTCRPAFDRQLAEALRETPAGTEALVEPYKTLLKPRLSNLQAVTRVFSRRAARACQEAQRLCPQTQERRQRFALQRLALAA